MRFGGHETFPVREGWLYKGLRLIDGDAEAFNDPQVADRLGVGRNMAKGIRYWLLATGLAEAVRSDHDPKRKKLLVTPLGALIYRGDPFFLQFGTWAALHLNLINAAGYARAWQWFFDRFSEPRFDRLTCSAALERFVERHERRSPAAKTLQRDVACLLSSYATPVPSEANDPEDASDSPFRRLGLMTLFRDSNAYRRNEPDVATLPPELLGYGLAACGVAEASVGLREACFFEGGPGKALQLSLNGFLDYVERAEQQLSEIALVGSAGERRIRIEALTPVEWLERYYDRLTTDTAAA